jgi:hypothetical protein
VGIIKNAKNSNGGILNLTTCSITAAFKQSATATTNLFTRRNATAGGSTAEIEVLSATNGIYEIKLVPANTSSLTIRSLYCLVTITISDVDYTETFYLKIRDNKDYGTPVDNVVLTPYKKIVWTMVNGGTPSLVLKAGFTGTPTATVSGNDVTLTSAALEFDATGTFFSNFSNYSISTSTTGSIVINYDDISSRTVTFGFMDETKTYISNSAYYDPVNNEVEASDFMAKGTTAERTAKGATLTSTDVFVWTDTTENTTYSWNGSEWV